MELEGQANRHEEKRLQDTAEGLDIGFQLVPIGRFGQQHAGEKGTHCHRKPGELHHRGRAHHDEKRGCDHHVARACTRDHLKERVEKITAGGEKCGNGSYCDREILERRRRILRRLRRHQRNDCKQRNDRKVLEQENGKGALAVACIGIVVLFQDLHGEGGGRKRQAKAGDNAGGAFEKTAERDQERKSEAGDHDLCGAEPEYIASHLPESRRF